MNYKNQNIVTFFYIFNCTIKILNEYFGIFESMVYKKNMEVQEEYAKMRL